MVITVELPQDIAQHNDPSREALEALAVAGYKSESLSHQQAAVLLGMDRFEFDSFLKQRNILDHAYDASDLRHDAVVIGRLDALGLLGR